MTGVTQGGGKIKNGEKAGEEEKKMLWMRNGLLKTVSG